MPADFWFNRHIEYWNLPAAEDVLDHVRRARVQVVQMGNFGPDFYSVAEDPEVARSLCGMPVVGIEPNLALAAQLIPQVRDAGARVVGQLSMTLYFGDHEAGLGLFGPVWEQMWTPAILGTAPADSVTEAAALTDGAPSRRIIEGRPYFTCRGCIANPVWLTTLKAMVTKGIDLGLQGFNATHNYEGFCGCTHCADAIRRHLEGEHGLRPEELRILFGGDLDQIDDLRQPDAEAPEPLRRRFASVLEQGAARLRKAAFDEVFIAHGRALQPDLLLAQWYHKYGLRVNDERAGLPDDLWGKGEDYIWFSQGPYRWGSSIEQGYLADMGLQSRHMHLAGGGRPFVVNKYDYQRWRVWAAEAAAHGASALSFHAGPPRPEQEEDTRIAREDYFGPVIRYQRFIAEHEDLLHPAEPWSQVGVVYPRRAERDGVVEYLDVLKRVGEWLEDAHILFDFLFEKHLPSRAARYRVLILPDVQRLSDAEVDALRSHVECGGGLVLTGECGTRNPDDSPRDEDPLAELRLLAGVSCFDVPQSTWQPRTVVIRTLSGEPEMPVYTRLPDDDLGQDFVSRVEQVGGGLWLRSDAPWSVRVRAWLTLEDKALVLHWINYRQVEDSVIEIPIPIGPLQVELALPAAAEVERVEWRYPEMKAPFELEFRLEGNSLHFSIPRLIVYGMSVIRLRD